MFLELCNAVPLCSESYEKVRKSISYTHLSLLNVDKLNLTWTDMIFSYCTHGYACFCMRKHNIFNRLLSHLLTELSARHSVLHEDLPYWGELLSVADELLHKTALTPEGGGTQFNGSNQAPPVPVIPSPSTTASASNSTAASTSAAPQPSTNLATAEKKTASTVGNKRSNNAAKKSSDNAPKPPIVGMHNSPTSTSRAPWSSPIAATALMLLLFRTFQIQMENIAGGGTSAFVEKTKNGAGNGKDAAGKRKNIQQDAVEFLTFLLDSLHEELIGAERKEALLVAQQQQQQQTLFRLTPSPCIGLDISNTKSSTLTDDDIPLLARNFSGSMSIDGDVTEAEKRALTRTRTQTSSTDDFSVRLGMNTKSTSGIMDQSIAETEAEPGEGEDDGWNTVSSKSSKSNKLKAVIDTESKDRAAVASNASVISKIFHTTLR